MLTFNDVCFLVVISFISGMGTNIAKELIDYVKEKHRKK